MPDSAYTGCITIDPPLSFTERIFLEAFVSTRRIQTTQSPYHVGPSHNVLDPNQMPPDQPSLWCQWMPNTAGSRLEWDGVEKFYKAPEWMAYLRSHFITLGAARLIEPETQSFWTQHRMSGSVLCLGQDLLTDLTKIEVDDHAVWVSVGTWTDQAKSDFFCHAPFGHKTASSQKKNSTAKLTHQTLISALFSRPELVRFDARTRVPDFTDPATAALFERAGLDAQILTPAHEARPRAL